MTILTQMSILGYITQNKVFMNLISLSMQEKQLVLVNVTAGL